MHHDNAHFVRWSALTRRDALLADRSRESGIQLVQRLQGRRLSSRDRSRKCILTFRLAYCRTLDWLICRFALQSFDEEWYVRAIGSMRRCEVRIDRLARQRIARIRIESVDTTTTSSHRRRKVRGGLGIERGEIEVAELYASFNSYPKRCDMVRCDMM